MNNDRIRVVLANEPYTFRSALNRVMSRDGQWETYLVPEGSSASEVTEPAEVVFLTQAKDIPDSLVVTFRVADGLIEMRDQGLSEFFPYQSLETVFATIRKRLIGRAPPMYERRSSPSGEAAGEGRVRSP